VAVQGLYAVTPECADTSLLVNGVRQVLVGGAKVVQYRAKEASAALRREQARALSLLCAEFRVPLIINDWVDLALECGAQGVHLGNEDDSLAEVRQRLPKGQWLIGVSCYNSPQRAVLAQEAGADYVALGSFFTSSTKPNAVRATLEDLRATRLQVQVPVVAIGGITLENAAPLLQAGADALAVITALFNAPDVAQAAREFCHLMEPTS
jgi:thiamine-phosphate pyrophosphorylase